MVKPAGGECNLSCAYCYYLAKTHLYPHSRFRMDEALLEDFTRQYIAAQRVPEVTFAWQGGEPLLMGLPFYERALALQRRYRPAGMRIANALQTNGTLLDAAWCRFLRQHDFLIGLSLDGPRELHDAYRRDRAGRPTFERVMAGLAALHEHGVAFNILATVHAANAEHPLEVYRFLRDEAGARFIQFIPIVERSTGNGGTDAAVSSRSVRPAQYGRFLTAIFDEWVRRDVGEVFVQTFDMALVLEHNGDLYACDHFVEPRYRLGNIAQTPLVELVGSAQQRAFGEAKRAALPQQCRSCAVLFACHGGCPKDRFLRTADGEAGLQYLCEGYRAFFTHVDHPMRLMAAELRQGRHARNVILRLAEEDAERSQRWARAERNAPCPCGSGRKFKHCHGRIGRMRGAEGTDAAI